MATLLLVATLKLRPGQAAEEVTRVLDATPDTLRALTLLGDAAPQALHKSPHIARLNALSIVNARAHDWDLKPLCQFHGNSIEKKKPR